MAVPKPDWLQRLGPWSGSLSSDPATPWTVANRTSRPRPSSPVLQRTGLEWFYSSHKDFFVWSFSQKPNQWPRLVSRALLRRQSHPSWALLPQRQLPMLGSAPLQPWLSSRAAGAREWAPGSSLQGWGLLLQCHRQTHGLASARPAQGSNHPTTLPGLSIGNTTATLKYQTL